MLTRCKVILKTLVDLMKKQVDLAVSNVTSGSSSRLAKIAFGTIFLSTFRRHHDAGFHYRRCIWLFFVGRKLFFYCNFTCNLIWSFIHQKQFDSIAKGGKHCFSSDRINYPFFYTEIFKMKIFEYAIASINCICFCGPNFISFLTGYRKSAISKWNYISCAMQLALISTMETV